MPTSRSGFLMATACFVFAAGTVGTTISGCCSTERPVGGIHLLVGLDTSESARELLGPAMLLTTRLTRRLQSGDDRITLYRVDRETQEFSDQEVPASTIALQQTLVEAVQSAPAHNKTFPARFWATVAARTEQARQPVGVVFFTDGDNDDLTARSKHTIRAAAQKLADNPHVVAVTIYGATPENWAYLRDCFQSMGDRFLLYNPTEMDIEPLACRLNQARR